MRSTRPFASDYMTLIARAHLGPAAPAVRTNFFTLHKPRVGVKVQAWFVRHTPTRVPELRVGISFDAHDPSANAAAGDAFAARFGAELRALDAERWPGEVENDRRYMTPIPLPPPGADLAEVIARAAALAAKYVDLIHEWARRDTKEETATGNPNVEIRHPKEAESWKSE